MNQLTEEIWNTIRPEIVHESKAIFDSEQYDAAIFAAFKYIEGEIQERIASKNVGIQLLNEAFDAPSSKIRISDDNRDQEGIKKLFEGALTNIRNDRGHKKAPFLPCKSPLACFQPKYRTKRLKRGAG